MKKAIIIIIFIILVFVALYFSLVFWVNNQNTDEENQKVDFFPISELRDIFGNQPEIIEPEENNTPQIEEGVGTDGTFKIISQNEVAGFTVNNKDVLYVEAGTGHFFNYNPENDQEEQLTNTTIPGVKRVWINPINTAINSLIGNIQNDETRVVSVSFEKPEQDEIVSFEANEIIDGFLSASVSPNKTQRFLLQEFNNSSAGFIENLVNNNSRQVFSSPFKNWDVDWFGASLVSISSKGSLFTPGTVSILNTNNQTLNTVLSGIFGLTSKISPNGSKVLYTEKTSADNFLELKLLETSAGNNDQLLSFITLADKCVWSKNSIIIYCGVNKTFPSGNLPDDWYKGKVLFDEDIWVVNTETGESSYITNTDSDVKIDILQPALDEDEEFIYFINKNDSKLWSVKLRNEEVE